MIHVRARWIVGVLSCLAISILAPVAAAQGAYPDRPIKLIVPFAPGGVYDAIGRPLADRIKQHLGTVVVENVGGAGGARGVTMAARAPADGYTIVLGGNANFVIAPIASRKPAYDPVNDFEPIARLAVVGLSFVVGPALQVPDLKSLVDVARREPAKVAIATPGVGTTNHFVAELLKSLVKLPSITHVPYTGAGPALNDVIGGHVPVIVANVTGQVLELHKAGKVKVLAVTSEKRLSVAPEIPTGSEAGVPGLRADNFFGLFAPKGTPPAIIDRLSKAVNATLADPELRALYAKAGFETETSSSPAQLRDFMAAEIVRWRPIIEATGFKIE